jgi:hypothetical protein
MSAIANEMERPKSSPWLELVRAHFHLVSLLFWLTVTGLPNQAFFAEEKPVHLLHLSHELSTIIKADTSGLSKHNSGADLS